MSSSKQKGFTLIELLVVVSIISLLSSVVITSVSAAREKSAISKIVQQVRQVQTALEMYRTDHGDYPDHYSSNYGLSHVLKNELSTYITLPNIETDGVRSFSFVVDEGDSFQYLNNAKFNGAFFSCGNSVFTPYIILFGTDKTGLDFNKVTFNFNGETENLSATEYCISTSI